MSKITEILLVFAYNLALLAGASYLYVVHNVSGWIFVLALVFGASYKGKKDE